MRGHLALAVTLVAALSGCKANPYCLSCRDQGGAVRVDLATGPSDLASVDLPPQVLLDMTAPVDGLCMPSNGGVEICDHLDNNCDGVVDNVDTSKLVGDPNNCGACFNVCDYTAQHQFGACVGGFDGGMPHCVPGACTPGYIKLPGHATCDYACTPSNGGVEICDGKDNDCNGLVDDTFTAAPPAGYADGNAGQMPLYNSDAANCGACAGVCQIPGAVNQCVPNGTTGQGKCTVLTCINQPGTTTYRHNPLAGDINVTGCEYHCPFPSTTSGDCDASPSTCTFPAEICNGIDDNCNFLVDDNPTDVGGSCGSCPNGVCKGVCSLGTSTCTKGVKTCVGLVGPSPETCNKVDDDCNGLIDDPFTAPAPGGYADGNAGQMPLYNSDPNNCGVCKSVCSLAHAVNKCASPSAGAAGQCAVLQCNSGFAFATLSPKAGDAPGTCTGGAPGVENGPSGIGCYYACPQSPSSPEVCDGIDNNCDGCVDNSLTKPSSFCATKGVCAGNTIAVNCNGGSGWKCDYSKVPNVDLDTNGNLTAVEVHCDALDNNCNGVVDKDGFPTLGNNCSAGVGICRNSGTIGCSVDHLSATCGVSAAPTNAVDETCDGKDNDCDGQIDERTPVAGSQCYNGGKHNCVGYVDGMVKVTGATTYYVYQYEAARPDASSTSGGALSTRACAKSLALPWTSVNQTEAAAACAAVLDSTGASMRLCTAAEWTAACEGPSNPTPPSWSFASSDTTYQSGVCDDSNGARTGPWGSGTGASCYTSWPTAPNKIYDLSGNVSEWTSSTVTDNGVTYYALRGGAYDTLPAGTTCEFDTEVFPASFENTDIGFRCCSDNAP